MSRLFIGHKPGVGGVVKVMKNNGDDPFTTPNTDYSKFLFNSETGKIGYVKRIERHSYNWAYHGQHGLFYEPSGTNINSCLRAYSQYNFFGDRHIFYSRILGLAYPPVAEFRNVKSIGERVEGPKVWTVKFDENTNGQWVGAYVGQPTYNMDTRRRFWTVSDPPYVWTTKAEGATSPYRDDGPSILSIVYDLPADETPMPAQTPAGGGTRSVLITPTTVRVAKAGASVDSGDPDDLIINSNKVPLKIARAGRINLSAWQAVNVHTDGPALTADTYVDYMVWEQGGPQTVPQHVPGSVFSDQNFRFEYEIHPNHVKLVNNGDKNLTVTYVITRESGQTTSGGSKVFETLSGGHVRIKRPGSSDTNPSDSDILLDTRAPYMPILSEGYLAASDFNEGATNKGYGDRAKTISFTNGGFIPFLKYYVKRRDRDGNFYAITAPKASILRGNIYGGQDFYGMQTSDGTVAIVSDTSVKFHMALGHPYQLEVGAGGGLGSADPVYSNQDKPIGIRYYIFGIPANL